MKWAFWAAVFLIGYAYVGYAGGLWLYSRVRGKRVRKAAIEPSVTVVMAVHNAGNILRAKLENLLSLDYLRNLYDVIVVSDGSSDDTNTLLSGYAAPVRSIIQVEHMGKAAALNRAVSEARGEIVVFTDVRQRIETGALRALISNFADEAVGCVSGELMLERSATGRSGIGLYWRVEKAVRQLESSSGSVVGATGAFYAIRKQLFVPIPNDAILDDVIVPLSIGRGGKRVVFEPEARAWDCQPFGAKTEFQRKVRTLTGNYQLLRVASWAFTTANPLLVRFISHKIIRLVVPFALLFVFAASWLSYTSGLYLAAALAQTCFYCIGGVGLLLRDDNRGRIVSFATAFCLLNAAAAVAFFKFILQGHDTRRLWRTTSVQADQLP